MIKVFTFVRRRQGLSPEEFHSRWRDHHAEFLETTPAAHRLVVRCELNHRLSEDYARRRHPTEFPGPEWDGVAVQWFEGPDNLRAFQALSDLQEFRRAAAERYGEDDCASVITHEPTSIIAKPGGRERSGLKLLCILRRNAALERAEFFEYWRERHGGLFKNISELNEPLLGYDQNHGLDIEAAPYDGVTEQWFESLQSWVDSLSIPIAEDLVVADGAYMLDTNSIQFILAGRPTVILGH